MKSSIWRLAGVGLLCMSVSAQSLAEQQDDQQRPRLHNGQKGEGQREHGAEVHQGNNRQHPENNQPRAQNNQPQNNQARPESNQPRAQNNQPHVQTEIIRGNNSRQFERSSQIQGGQWQNRPLYDPNVQSRPVQQQPVQQQPVQQLPVQQQPSNNLPIQSRPDTVRQTQEPLRGYYEDIPRRNDRDQRWQTGGGGSHRANDYRWPGRPGGHGTGWGPGPQYRPGYVVDRFPDRNYRVPYHGRDYFFSGGYWYSPHGPRYVVVRPPRGIRISYLPDYAREIWIGSALFFLAAGVYYMYEANTQQYVVVDPPQPQPVSYGYDVIAYPANGQTPEQINQDRYDCYRWAVEQSGFDPAAVTYQPAPGVVQTYRQAQGNCLSSRGYQVTY